MKKSTIGIISLITGALILGAVCITVPALNNWFKDQGDSLSQRFDKDKSDSTIPEESEIESFKIVGTTSGYLAYGEDSLTYSGSWNDNFCLSDRYNTLSTDYSFKTHVVNNIDKTESDDVWIAFCVYYEKDYHSLFGLRFNSSYNVTAPVNGSIATCLGDYTSFSYDYQLATLPDALFSNSTGFNDVWTDGTNWLNSDGEGFNLRENSYITIEKGFDLTLNVKRQTYKDRLVDVMQLKIDAFALDGVTPATYYSPLIASDAFTNPKGNGESKFVNVKPQIGFMNSGGGKVTFSNISFIDNTAK